ncbi:MAG: aminoacetone oxidase family FAD-binding enzyme [Clostridiales bacterium]|nr:aminoacetone oxidase family FAD-binding enzyme [Clostridiales bacterium]
MSNHEIFDIAVIGAGASGLMAAYSAVKEGASSVCILEKNEGSAKKLLRTGNGRCNITNLKADDSTHYRCEDISFVRDALKKFSVSDAVSFFESIGIIVVKDEDSKLFPMSFQAAFVCSALTNAVKKAGVDIKYPTQVGDIKKKNNVFNIETNNGDIRAKAVIIATGGAAAPDSGSDGYSNKIASSLGHSTNKYLPVISALITKDGFIKRVDGVKIEGTLSLEICGKIVGEYNGDILFTNYGISGPPAFSASLDAIKALDSGEEDVYISLNLSHGVSFDSIADGVLRLCRSGIYSTVDEVINCFTHKKLVAVILSEIGISEGMPVEKMNMSYAKGIAKAICSLRRRVVGVRGFEYAQGSLGGVSVLEIDRYTMSSLIHSGLYFSGEAIDVTGECGGYNLQWAWTSGNIAGKAAAQYVKQ